MIFTLLWFFSDGVRDYVYEISTLRVKQVNLTYLFSKLIILHRKFRFLSIDEVARLLFYMCFDNKSKLSLSFFFCFFFNHLALS